MPKFSIMPIYFKNGGGGLSSYTLCFTSSKRTYSVYAVGGASTTDYNLPTKEDATSTSGRFARRRITTNYSLILCGENYMRNYMGLGFAAWLVQELYVKE